MTLNFLRTLTAHKLRELTEEQLTTLIEDFEGETFNADWLARMFEPLLNPTGVWADYNPALYYWYDLYRMGDGGLFPLSVMPPQPDPADYPNLIAPRSAFYAY